MKRIVALSLLLLALSGCSQTQVAVTPTAVPPAKAPPRVVDVKPVPTPTFMPVSSTGLPTMPGQRVTAPQIVVRRALRSAASPNQPAIVARRVQVSNSNPTELRRAAADNAYMALVQKWQNMLIGSIKEYHANPSRETALVMAANVDAIWDERISNFVTPPAFLLADNLLGEGLMKMRSGIRRAKWGGDTNSAQQDIETGIRLIGRSWDEAANAADSEAKRIDALP